MTTSQSIINSVNQTNCVLIIQAENPDGDSLACSLALEEIFSSLKKPVSMHCSVDMPKYLRFLSGWDRVSKEIPKNFDLAIIVDANSLTLLERTLSSSNLHKFNHKTMIVIDHHSGEVNLPIKTINLINTKAVSTGEIIFSLVKQANWPINANVADYLASSIMSDSLGLVSSKTTSNSIRILADLVDMGADLTAMDNFRRIYSKKSEEIFRYKGRLFERVELKLDGKLAICHIPWDEIEAYSDQYNPAMLIIDEMRQIDGVSIAAVFKTYPDGKITCKLRSNPPTSNLDSIAHAFGGGGHPFAAGFKQYDIQLEDLKKEFVSRVNQELDQLEL